MLARPDLPQLSFPRIGRLSGAVPVYAAPAQDVCGVDMEPNSVRAVAAEFQDSSDKAIRTKPAAETLNRDGVAAILCSRARYLALIGHGRLVEELRAFPEARIVARSE